MARCLCAAAAALLLLAAGARADAPDWPFGLAEDGCPPVAADLVALFTVGGATDNATLLTKGQAVNLGCNLLRLLDRDAAGNASATDALQAMYAAWRAAYRPQEWQSPKAAQAAWRANLAAIAQANDFIPLRWWGRLNAYSEMDPATFAATVLMRSDAAAASAAAPIAAPSGGARKLLRTGIANPTPAYPVALNWTTAGKVLPAPGFQRQCASSWAFAAAAALESRLLIATGANTTAALSPQHIMDCTAALFGYNLSTCTGGSPADAFAFAATTGVAADEAVRYRSERGGSDASAPGFLSQCDRGFLTGQAAKLGTVQITGAPASAAVPATKLGLIGALQAQPAVATLWVDASFQHYHAGIWSSANCQPGAYPAQSLLVVGYDTSRPGWELFHAKNSLGASWGERGMVRLAMAEGEGLCGMYRAALQPGAVTALAAGKPGNGKGKAA